MLGPRHADHLRLCDAGDAPAAVVGGGELIDLPDDWGRCEPTPDGTRILVGEALGGAALLRTILHEAIHAISYAQGLDLKEKHVAGLEAGLSALLRLNPEFAKALTKHL